ncbi:hypothetical protein KCV06_g256, partial [Aureobasidium melanogenum]
MFALNTSPRSRTRQYSSSSSSSDVSMAQRDSMDIDITGVLDIQRALDIARNTEGDLDYSVAKYLEEQLAQVWGRLESRPNSYVLSKDEFAIFNYFVGLPRSVTNSFEVPTLAGSDHSGATEKKTCAVGYFKRHLRWTVASRLRTAIKPARRAHWQGAKVGTIFSSFCNLPFCYVPLQQRIENNALYTSGRSNQVGKRVQNCVWLSVDPFLPGVTFRLFTYLTQEQTKDTRLLTESQKDEKEPERSEIETSQGKHRFCPEKTAHAIVAVGSHAVSSTTCKEVYLFLILAALTFFDGCFANELSRKLGRDKVSLMCILKANQGAPWHETKKPGCRLTEMAKQPPTSRPFRVLDFFVLFVF